MYVLYLFVRLKPTERRTEKRKKKKKKEKTLFFSFYRADCRDVRLSSFSLSLSLSLSLSSKNVDAKHIKGRKEEKMKTRGTRASVLNKYVLKCHVILKRRKSPRTDALFTQETAHLRRFFHFESVGIVAVVVAVFSFRFAQEELDANRAEKGIDEKSVGKRKGEDLERFTRYEPFTGERCVVLRERTVIVKFHVLGEHPDGFRFRDCASIEVEETRYHVAVASRFIVTCVRISESVGAWKNGEKVIFPSSTIIERVSRANLTTFWTRH